MEIEETDLEVLEASAQIMDDLLSGNHYKKQKEARMVFHYGFHVDPEVPITGVFQCNNLEYIHEDSTDPNAVDLDFEQHLQECESIQKDEICDCMVESSTFLIGFKKNEVGLYEPDPEAEYSTIVRYDSNVIQVLRSKWGIRCALCSPCYPGQGDGDTPGEFLAFAPPPEVVGNGDTKLMDRIFEIEFPIEKED